MEVWNNLQTQFGEEMTHLLETMGGEELNTATYALQRRHFGRYDRALDSNPNGPYWLREPKIAQVVADSLQHCAEQNYFHLWAYCIMSNHVHLLVKHREEAPLLTDILQRHKGYTGSQCNKLLLRNGPFWWEESYDHLVRDEAELHRIAWYILQNPVKAGLVARWQDWPYTFADSALFA